MIFTLTVTNVSENLKDRYNIHQLQLRDKPLKL
jgi:hypothetical protein